MERWNEIEESCHGIKESLESLSDCVLAVPDASIIGDLLNVDKMAKGEMEIHDELPNGSDSLEVGRIINHLEERGVFIPNNFNLLGKILYPTYLRDSGIPIPEFELVGLKSDKLTEDQIKRLSVGNDQDFYIIKSVRSHRGKGIKIVSEAELSSIQTDEEVLIVQRFWWPRRENGYVRDVRVVTINGEPRDFCVRQAKEPLVDLKTGKLVEYPPSLSQVLANVAQGGTVVKVPRRLQNRLFDLARVTCSAIKDYAIWVREKYMKANIPEKVNLGLMSVDILLGEEGLAVCEVDTLPDLHFFPDLRRVGKPYVDYLKDQTEGGKKPVLLFQEMLGSRVRMPISPELLEKFLEQENVPYVPFRFAFG